MDRTVVDLRDCGSYRHDGLHDGARGALWECSFTPRLRHSVHGPGWIEGGKVAWQEGVSRQQGRPVAAFPAPHTGADIDIVERALAILDEESRSWVSRRRAVPSPSSDVAPSAEWRGDGGAP
jgi:hypothetical protein